MRFLSHGLVAAAAVCVIFAAPTLAAPALGACSILSRAEVKQFSGGSPVFDMLPPEEEKVGGGSSCNYPQIFIQIDPFPFATIDAERGKPGEKFETVPGVGDVAYTRENTRSDDAEIFFRVGQRVATIQMDIPVGATYDSVKPRLFGLAKALAAKMK